MQVLGFLQISVNPVIVYNILNHTISHPAIKISRPLWFSSTMASISLGNLLMQPKLWRLVGFVSSLVGLLCFARSKSFEFLLGERNFHKMCLYTAISGIILGFMLLAHKWQLSRNLLFKVHAGFLVLTLTSLFSVFSNDKLHSDSLSLISCVSFAVASLSLSIQINLGFEADLFNFILGLLVFLLMMKNKWLAFVGIPICFVLVLLRSYMDSQLHPQLHSGTVSGNDHLSLRIDTPNEAEGGADNSSHNGYYTIEKRFRFPANIEDKLKSAVAAGFVNECCHLFIGWRRQLLNDRLLRIQIQKLNPKEIDKVPLNFLEGKIKRWNTISDHVLRRLLPDERNLCKRLFSEFPRCEVFCFNELCQEPMIQLLDFADAIASGKGSPERLFGILSMLEMLRQLWPDFDSLFSDQCSVFLKNRAVKIWRRLRKEIKGVFMDLENLILEEQEKVALPHGGLHPMTHYIINYLCLACKSWRTLERVFRDSELPLRTYSEVGNGESLSSPFSPQLTRIMDLLEKRLKTISEGYGDSVLCSVFMMNNESYIVQKAKRSEVGRLLSEDWIKDHVLKVQEYILEYKKKSWSEVVEMLTTDSARPEAEKLKLFRLKFERICEEQSKWVVFDEHLGEKIRSSLKKKLSPANENFMARFDDAVNREGVHNHVKQEDIVAGINKLFKGKDELRNFRNIQPTWRVVKATDDDAYEWTKHGQETALNCGYPRYHYWCVNKVIRGCQATKEVQQKGENPEMYETRYVGFHTCRMSPSNYESHHVRDESSTPTMKHE